MGRLIDATTFADLEARRFTLRVSATRRDTKASRKDTKKQHGSKPNHMRQSVTWFVASRLGARRILRQIRARIARWSREDKSRSRRQTTHPEWHTLRHGKATCLPWRILYQLYASQIDAATNNVAFFVWFREIFASHHVAETRRVKRCDCGRRRSARQ